MENVHLHSLLVAHEIIQLVAMFFLKVIYFKTFLVCTSEIYSTEIKVM